ncbi:MAG: secondary thiamine-phosphate synthase enzyme YjbQ [Armatimonadota bacterium]|nr:secondary thiamine-phosphate synthase enzyme YjbQ [Armatimonadota bacterium]
MKVVNTVLSKQTQGNGHTIDLTADLQQAVHDSGVREGVAALFVIGSTAALTTMEFEPGLVSDLQKAFEGIAPAHAPYAHEARWGDDNGHAHVRASLLGPSLIIPIVQGQATLGTWQQVVLIDFDTRPRQRRVVVQIMGS